MTGADRPPTMRDVAVLAGVSHQTVSRYLQQDPTVMPDTGRRVAAAVARLGYVPNLAARSMRTRRSGVLAIVLPGFHGVAERTVAAACDEARLLGFRVEVLIGMDEPPHELGARADALVTSGEADGVLSFSPLRRPGSGRGVVVEAHQYDEQLRVADAAADDRGLADDLVATLADLGHRDLLHVAGPPEWTTARLRREGYLAALHRLDLRSHGEPSGPWHPDTGLRAVRDLPDDTPVTAVVAANDIIAAGVLRGLHERGWAVPDRMSVTGWGDQLLTRYTTPALSTVVVDRESAGRHAMQRLVAAVRGQDPPPAPTGPLGRIQMRETTAPPGGH